jgi:hypothetical protein
MSREQMSREQKSREQKSRERRLLVLELELVCLLYKLRLMN